MKITVYGSWHLAEVYAIGLCEFGHSVNLISDGATFENYLQGKPPVFEPGIAEGLKKYGDENRLVFSKNIADPKNKTEICFFAEDVNITPNGVDLKSIENHFRRVVSSGSFKIICVSSQLPIGTCETWQKKYPKIQIVYFPEFLRFGDALTRFIKPDYIVLGGKAKPAEKIAAVLESVNSPKFFVTLNEAEMSKHAANIFVAMSVSFVSELTKFSKKFNVNLEKIGAILRNDKRVGPKAYVMPGLGFSGTVERDLKVLLSEAKKIKARLPLFENVIKVNNAHNHFIEMELAKRFKNFKNKKISFLGATYKPFTSNMRGSLVAPLMKKLEALGARVSLFDPLVSDNHYKALTVKDVLLNADAVVVVVGKKDIKEAPYQKLIPLMKRKIIIDAANMFSKEDAERLKVDYSSIGRGN